MDRTTATYALQKFQEYRSKYVDLAEIYAKNGHQLQRNSSFLKIGNETFTSSVLMREEFDYAFHNCGVESYPEGLTNNSGYYGSQTLLSEKQQVLLKEIFFNLGYDRDALKSRFEAYRGLWWWGISSERIYGSKGESHDTEDYLSIAIPGISELVQDLAKSADFKRIEYEIDENFNRTSRVDNSSFTKSCRKMDPRERMREISNFFMALHLAENFVCVHFEKSCCRLCGEDFYPQCGSEWAGLVPPEYCPICLELSLSRSNEFYRFLGYKEEQRKSNAVEGIKVFCEYFGFIPRASIAKRRVISQLYDSGIREEELDMALRVSSLLPSNGSAKTMFGSWAHLLEAGNLLEQRQRGHGGHQSIGSDGHLCLSMGERAICEYLTRKGLSHEKEPNYPFDDKLNPNGLFRGDFRVGQVIVEFAGMMSDQKYAEKMDQKRRLADKFEIPWVKIESSDLENLDSMLTSIISHNSRTLKD